MSLVKIDWKPSAKSLRSFGLVVLIGLGVFAAVLYFWLGQKESGIVAAIAAAVLGLPGLTGTRIALPGYWLWMGIAFVMGNIMSRVIMAIIYYGVLTPTGLLMKIFGIDKLNLKRKPVATYWKNISEPQAAAERYERQF
jgi:hypothetical protein